MQTHTSKIAFVIIEWLVQDSSWINFEVKKLICKVLNS